jgi:hypothetical protein
MKCTVIGMDLPVCNAYASDDRIIATWPVTDDSVTDSNPAAARSRGPPGSSQLLASLGKWMIVSMPNTPESASRMIFEGFGVNALSLDLELTIPGV